MFHGRAGRDAFGALLTGPGSCGPVAAHEERLAAVAAVALQRVRPAPADAPILRRTFRLRLARAPSLLLACRRRCSCPDVSVRAAPAVPCCVGSAGRPCSEVCACGAPRPPLVSHLKLLSLGAIRNRLHAQPASQYSGNAETLAQYWLSLGVIKLSRDSRRNIDLARPHAEFTAAFRNGVTAMDPAPDSPKLSMFLSAFLAPPIETACELIQRDDSHCSRHIEIYNALILVIPR